ncbi:MAG: FtsX-like permease family protein [Microbacterium sp.]|uniref:FtsX-like permease family protein n=1 Tax=Microbacterium sp. TaxID=51671 RepID=UPI003A83DABC
MVSHRLFCGYLVVLLAGAAFSVGARRQQRPLAMAASVGADRRDLFHIVLLQGTVLGAIGGVAGTATGIGLGALALPLFSDGSVSTNWGLHVPWPLLVSIVVFATLVGTASAVLPARAATRGDTLAAQRGARKPVAAHVARPLWGSLLITVGVATTAVSGLTLAALNAAEFDNSPIRTLCLYGVIGGPVLFQVGVLLGGHWLLALIQRGISSLGLAPRLAGRDAAAHPGRIVPAFGAIAACTFLAAVALASVGVTTAAVERGWEYRGPLGSTHVTVYSDGASDDDAAALVDAAYDAIEATGPLRTAEVLSQPHPFDPEGTPSGALVVSPRVQQFVDCDEGPSAECRTADRVLLDGHYRLAVIDPADLAVAFGADPGRDAAATMRTGGALVTSPARLDDGQVELDVFTVDDLRGGMFGGGTPDPVTTELVAGALLDLGHRIPYDVVISPQTAADLGVTTRPSTLIATYAEPARPDVLDRIQADLSHASVGYGGYGWGIENGPPAAAPWLWLILAATSVLVIGASTVALGLARVERRPDDATLTAVGAGAGLRRGIAFWQALIVTGLGGITGAIAGLLPVWGAVLMTQNIFYPPQLADTPWLWLGILALGLPLTIAVVSWIVPPRHPDLTRRTAIT